MSLEAKDIREGTQLGHYVIMEHIADGGMGSVFKAFEPALERYVAIKVLKGEFAQDEDYIAHFQNEARAVAALRHANIVPIYYIGREEQIAYFSMAYIEGKTLDDLIEDGIRFKPNQGLWFMNQAIAALDCAAASNIIHLDIKPSNFIIDPSNILMLTDFGLAERLGQIVDPGEKEVFGTPAYVAPEQINKKATDQRTDIYSLGATLFHLMAGHPPYDGQTVEEIVLGHLQKDFPVEAAQKAGIPEGWINLLSKMMEREPANRFQNYEELTEATTQVESFRYQTTQIVVNEESNEVAHLIMPQESYAPEWLHGLLRESSGDWVSGGVNDGIKYTRRKVLEGIRQPLQPMTVEKLAKTMKELCKPGESDWDDLLQAMEQIPSFSQMIFSLANFLENNPEQPIVDEQEAIQSLGLGRSRDLALTSFMLNYEWQPAKNFDWLPLWRHSVAVAFAVDYFYESLNLKRSGLEFAAGLSHDVGKLILGEAYPFVYYCAMNRSLKKQLRLTECEDILFEINHAEIGGVWLEKEGMPPGLIDAVKFHEYPETSKKPILLAYAVNTADQLINQLGIGYSGNAVLPNASWTELESTGYLWEHRRQELDWEEFAGSLEAHFRNFPNLQLRG